MFKFQTSFNLLNLEASESKKKQSQGEALNKPWTLAHPDANHIIKSGEFILPETIHDATTTTYKPLPVGKRLDAFIPKK